LGAIFGSTTGFGQSFPSLSKEFQTSPRKIQAFPSFFKAFSKEFQTFFLAVFNELKGLPAMTSFPPLLKAQGVTPSEFQ
jgi:hypothetical protein